jgi:UDP-glucose 6-dehydrogenase
MNVSIVGSGYVGTTIAACLADCGHEVVNTKSTNRSSMTSTTESHRFTSPGWTNLWRNTVANACAHHGLRRYR